VCSYPMHAMQLLSVHDSIMMRASDSATSSNKHSATSCVIDIGCFNRTAAALQRTDVHVGQLYTAIPLLLLPLLLTNRSLKAMKEHMLGQLEQTVAALYAAGVDCGESHLTATSAATSDSLHRGLQELLTQFGPSCDERLSVMAYQFNQLDALLLPPYTRFVLWLMAQPDSFFKSSKALCSSSSGAGNCTPGRRSAAGAELAVKRAVLLLGDDVGATVDVTAAGASSTAAAAGAGAATPPLWALLCQELGLTAEQEDKLKACHVTAARDPRTKADRGTLRQLVQLVSELRAGCELYASSAQQRLQALTALLSPQQMVSYLAWVSKNRPAVRRCAERLSAVTAQHALGSEEAATAAAVGVTPLQMPVAQQQQVLQQQGPATLSPVSSHLLAFAEQQQVLLNTSRNSADGSNVTAAAAADSMRDSSLSPPLLSLLPSSTAAADLQPIMGDQLTSSDVCVESFATDFDSSVQLGADADINSDLLSFTEAFAGGGFADSSSSTAFTAGFPGLMDVSTDTLHSAPLQQQQQQQQRSGECSSSNNISSSSGSSECAKAKLLRLLNTADDQLSLSDMMWLMSWLKSNRAQRGASPLPDRPARRSDALLSSARALATGVCDVAAANASAQTSTAIAAAATAADGNSGTVGLNGSSSSSVEALAALQQQQQQQHRFSVIAEHSDDDDSNSDTATVPKRKSSNYLARSSG
jgi:hypothetical protein